MSDGYRNASITAGLALIVCFAVGGYILGNQLGIQDGRKDAHATEYAHHAANEIKSTCQGLDPIPEAKCVVRVIEATNEHKRSEDDLNAQKNMARWALFMLLATIAMTLVTIFGVYYVWRTLAVTREIGQKQTRAYLGISKIDRDIAQGLHFFHLDNSGQTPAYDVQVGRYVFQGQSVDWDKVDNELRDDPRNVLNPGSGTILRVGISAAPAAEVIIAIKIVYIAAFKHKHVATEVYKNVLVNRSAIRCRCRWKAKHITP